MKTHSYNIVMNNNFLFKVICFISLVVCSLTASAFSASKYATTSKLATGKWVKIAIPEDGIYQITSAELGAMGFYNINNVRVYGTGGHAISEILDGTATDDLVQTPTKVYGHKLYFYACGPVKYSLVTNDAAPHYTREMNSYSQAGYYFITNEPNTPRREPTNATYYITGSNVRSTSLDYSHHELEVVSPSQSGKEMLGEIINDGGITLPYSLYRLCPDSAIVVNPCVAAKSEKVSNIVASVNGENVDLNIGLNKIYSSSSEYVFYNFATPSGIYRKESGIPANGEITMGVNNPVNWARLNYYLITFFHNNTLAYITDHQMRMGFHNVRSSDIIAINDATEMTEMWYINNPNEPVNYTLSTKDGITGFTPLYTVPWAQFIAFNPNLVLKNIAGFEHVENQNIHGMATPDMVIVTRKDLIPQAERIAQMHRDNDNMIVHVLDQQQVFNEFSSGTPDAMAIRLMCKMFYDRDSNKFKNLLMFGDGSYDNRQIFFKNDCATLTYESNISHDENNSYVSDDFFGMLEDNSGTNPASELLKIGVGRIPCTSLEEAESDVDKLINYVNNPDYGPWRNNILLVADYYQQEGNLHALQAEGIGNTINDALNIGVMKNKVFVKQFPLDPVTGFSLEGRKSLKSQLKSGQYFMTYVGHANSTSLTKEVNLWTTNESNHAVYPHLPIITTACCDVARFDGSERGLMEIMFHKPDGGVIAMVGATRSAYSSGNDALNQAFVNAMFCFNNKRYMPTLGEAYMLSKNSFGTTVSYNKMMFTLFGDPAMKLNYPKPFFKVTKVNGYSAGTSNISSGALQQVTVEAKVYTPSGDNVDVSFNGDATLTIYDYLKKELTDNGRDIYFPRQMLTQVTGRVENGVFTGKAVIPRHTLNPGYTGLISVYAHRDNSDEMVNGSFDKLVLNAYNENNVHTIHDNTPPTIEAIYFNDEEEFDMCNQVGTTATLFIRATDDFSFNTQAVAIGNSMDIKIDGGKTSVTDINSFASMSNEGKTLNVAVPISLDPGNHTLQYTVYDAAGNTASRSLNFAVGAEQEVLLSVEQEPAVGEVTFNISTDLPITPNVNIKIFDHVGKLKWQTTTSNFPFDWNLTDANGKKLPAGIYTFYGKYKDGSYYGGTNTGTLIVADEIRRK